MTMTWARLNELTDNPGSSSGLILAVVTAATVGAKILCYSIAKNSKERVASVAARSPACKRLEGYSVVNECVKAGKM